ncbi:MAG: twin-arginine translocation signal domain-containing protein, partial [Chthoniobacteraceae bacterium]
MNDNHPHQCNNVMPAPLTRRDLLKTVSAGFGWLAFQGLAGHAEAAASTASLAVRAPHFPPKAKRVIFLCMQG